MNLYDNRPMSVVTNVVLKTSVEDKGRIVRLNKVFRPRKEFVSCDDGSLPCGWYAGGKFLECEIYPGSFNGLVLEELIEAIRKVDWDDPYGVQLFIQAQEEDRLKEVELGLLAGAGTRGDVAIRGCSRTPHISLSNRPDQRRAIARRWSSASR